MEAKDLNVEERLLLADELERRAKVLRDGCYLESVSMLRPPPGQQISESFSSNPQDERALESPSDQVVARPS